MARKGCSPFEGESRRRRQGVRTAVQRKLSCLNFAPDMEKRDRNLVNIPPLKSRRRELRSNPTPAEAILWKHIRGRQILGKKFRRQYSIGRYILDFFCPECDIAIELDGAPHLDPVRAGYDQERSVYLAGLGVEILRFQNHVVCRNIEAVLEVIREAIRQRGSV